MSTKRNLTNSDTPDWSLSEQQLTAIDLLVTGKNLQETADHVGVQRPTVSQWVNHHPGFQAALNQRRQELWADMVDGLRSLLPQAVQVLQRELEGEQALAAAVHVLKCCGLYGGMGAPSGQTDAAAGLDHGIGHFMLCEVDSAARAPAPPLLKLPQTSSVASDRKSAPQPSCRQAA
jgi:hypothetical protein